jgi:hypothetical protein
MVVVTACNAESAAEQVAADLSGTSVVSRKVIATCSRRFFRAFSADRFFCAIPRPRRLSLVAKICQRFAPQQPA